jgi:hypothetical protein
MKKIIAAIIISATTTSVTFSQGSLMGQTVLGRIC